MSKIDLDKAWLEVLENEFSMDYMLQIKSKLQDLSKAGAVVCPHPKNIFRALNLTPLPEVKIVILGQDPYHGQDQANGLAFSVSRDIKPPPSLQNIFKELNSDLGIKVPDHGVLDGWAKRGVLLLNATLTVTLNSPNSHKDIGWQIFTDRIIEHLGSKEKIVFMLWGSYARSKKSLINLDKNLVLEAPHPSPLSAHRGFLGSKHFSKANAYFKKNNITEMDWSLS